MSIYIALYKNQSALNSDQFHLLNKDKNPAICEVLVPFGTCTLKLSWMIVSVLVATQAYLKIDKSEFDETNFFLKLINGSPLAKMKKSIPDMSLPWNFQGWSSWSKKLQIYFKNYDLCEYMEFVTISWKYDILSTAF